MNEDSTDCNSLYTLSCLLVCLRHYNINRVISRDLDQREEPISIDRLLILLVKDYLVPDQCLFW